MTNSKVRRTTLRKKLAIRKTQSPNNYMSKYTFPNQAAKNAAIATETASTNETAEVRARHLSDLQAAEVTG